MGASFFFCFSVVGIHISVSRNDGCCRDVLSKESTSCIPTGQVEWEAVKSVEASTARIRSLCGQHFQWSLAILGSGSYYWGLEALLLSTSCPFTSFVTVQPQNGSKVWRIFVLFFFFFESVSLLLILLGSKERFRISLTSLSLLIYLSTLESLVLVT